MGTLAMGIVPVLGQGVAVKEDYEWFVAGNVNGQFDREDATGLTVNIVDTNALAGNQSLLFQYDRAPLTTGAGTK